MWCWVGLGASLKRSQHDMAPENGMGWNTLIYFPIGAWDGLFSGAMFVSLPEGGFGFNGFFSILLKILES